MEENLANVGLKNETASSPDNVASFRIMLPGPKYFLTLLRRYFFACLLIVIPFIILGFAGVRLFKNEYLSVTRTLYDNRIMMYEPGLTTLHEYPAFSQVGADVTTYLSDEDFFLLLCQKSDYCGSEELPNPRSPLNRLVSFIKIHLFGEPLPTLQEQQKQQQLTIARRLQRNVVGQFDPSLLSITIGAKASSPAAAQKLSHAVMNLIVENLYKKELDRIERSIADLETYFKTEARNMSGGESASMIVPSARGIFNDASAQLTEVEKNELIGKAQRLGKKLQEAKEAYQQIYKIKMDQKLALEAELNRMQTHMKPTHPLLISRQEELKHVLESREIFKAKQDVDELTQDLRAIQLKLQRAGIFINENSLLDTSAGHDSNSFYASLGKRIQELRAEKISLQNQLENPALRNRYRLAEDASFPNKSSNAKKKLLLILAVPGIALVIALLTIIFCELFSAYPRDSWKIVNALKQPLLGELKTSRISHLPVLDLATIIEMKQALTTKGRKSVKLGRVYLTYRTLITKMKQRMAGRIIMLQPMELMELDFPLIQNMINVFAADFSQKVLLIDFNRKEPALPATTKGRDIYSLIEHKIRLEDLIIHRDEKVLFDRIAARDDLPPTAIRAEFLKRLFELLLKKYNYIFLYGLDAQHFLENNLIAQTVTDCFTLVPANKITYTTMDLADKNIDKSRMHGFFVIF